MHPTFSAEDRIILQRLQSELSERLHGTLEMGTTICLSPEGFLPTPREFLNQNLEVLHSFGVVLRACLNRIGAGSDVDIHQRLEALLSADRAFRTAFLNLAAFRSLPLQEVQAVTEGLEQAYNVFRQAIQELGEAVGLPVSDLRDQSADRNRYYQRILDNLLDLFRQAHPAKGKAVAS